jgi:hypothetical protein
MIYSYTYKQLRRIYCCSFSLIQQYYTNLKYDCLMMENSPNLSYFCTIVYVGILTR